MFHPSRVHHHSCRDATCHLHLPDTFGLLCWNVHKSNQSDTSFAHYLKLLVEQKKIDMLLFQEANFKHNEQFIFSDFSFDAAANLELGEKFYGVLTASKTVSKKSKASLTEGREALIGPRKSLLLSHYIFEDETTLLILNIHAINFREGRRYIKEMERLLTNISEYDGPMIIAGDFNSWSNRRMQKLHQIQERFSLQSVSFASKHHIKSFMNYPLDFIFYRGLELLDSDVISEQTLSDHNPLFARFRKTL